MKRITTVILIMTLVTAVFLTGCDAVFTTSEDGEKGSGNLETRQYDFTDFTRVDIGHAFRYEIEQSDTYSISITADDNIFKNIEVEKDGETLRIGLKPFISLFGSVTLEANITMPRLTGLESSGATRGNITGFKTGDNLDLEISGASKVNLVDIATGNINGNISGASTLEGKITAGNIDMEISGASNINGDLTSHDLILNFSGASKIDVGGSGNDILLDASGASRIELDDFSVNNADINLGGASSCDIDINGTLEVSLSGVSKLVYTGEAVIIGTDISGGSLLRNKSKDS
jgi:hypothetical protein